jgi:hypothetical protein
VRVVLGGDPSKSTAVDLAKYIDREHSQVRSITGEMTLDYGHGCYRIDAPMAKAVSGFLAEAGPQRLKDVTIACTNRYATIVIVPLDRKPIASSAKVLVQVGTISRPSGWTARPDRLLIGGKLVDCLHITDIGKPPWLVENTAATVTIANPSLTTATALDINGMATSPALSMTHAGGIATLTLPSNALYVVLSAGEPR